jgi:hypothetical protein
MVILGNDGDRNADGDLRDVDTHNAPFPIGMLTRPSRSKQMTSCLMLLLLHDWCRRSKQPSLLLSSSTREVVDS